MQARICFRYFFCALALCAAISHRASAQKNERYENYKKLVDTYGGVNRSKKGFYILSYKGKWGIADPAGNVMLPPVYDKLENYSYQEYKLISKDEQVVLDADFNIVQRGNFAQSRKVRPQDAYSLVFVSDRKGGIRRADGNWMVPPIYDELFNNDLSQLPYILTSKDQKAGVIDTFNRVLVPFRYDRVAKQGGYLIGYLPDTVYVYSLQGKLLHTIACHNLAITDGFVTVEKYGSWALASADFKPITAFIYKAFSSLGSAKYIMFERDFKGVMNAHGEIVLQDKYDDISRFGNDCYHVSFKDEGNILYNVNFHKLLSFHDASFTVAEARYGKNKAPDWINIYRVKEHRFDESQETIRSCYNFRLKKSFPFYVVDVLFNGSLLKIATGETENPTPARLRTRTSLASSESYITPDGKPFKFELDESYTFTRFLIVKNKQLYGLMDARLKLIFPVKYKEIRIINDSVFAVADTGLQGYSIVDKNGGLLVKDKLGNIPVWRCGNYMMTINGKSGLYNRNFVQVLPPVYEPEFYFPHDNAFYDEDSSRILITKDHKKGIADLAGNILIQPVYDDVYMYDRMFMLREDKKNWNWLLADNNGKMLITDTAVTGIVIMNEFGDRIYKVNRKWGMVNHYGDTLYPFVYDTMGPAYWLGKNSKYILLNNVGKLMASDLDCIPKIPNESYDTLACANGDALVRTVGNSFKKIPRPDMFSRRSITFHQDRNFLNVRYDQDMVRAGVYNRALRRVAPPMHNSDQAMETSGWLLYPDSLARSFAILDTAGDIVVPYTAADSFWLIGNVAIARLANARFLIFDLTKHPVKADTTSTAIFSARLGNGYTTGRQRFIAREARGIAHDVITYKLPTGYLMLNPKNGRTIISPVIPVAIHDYDTTIMIKENGSWTSVDLTTGEKRLMDYDTSYNSFYGNVIIVKNGKQGLLDRNYQPLIPPVYDSIYPPGYLPDKKYFVAKNEGKFSLVSYRNEVLTSGWDAMSRYSRALNDIVAVRNGHAHNFFINAAGQLVTGVVEEEYAEEYQYVNEQVKISRNGKFGIKDQNTRKIIIPVIYDYIDDQGDGYVARIDTGKNCATILYDEKGRKLSIQPCGSSISYENGFYAVQGSQKASALSIKGKVIVPAGYEDIEMISDNWLIVKKDEKYGVMTTSQKLIVPLIYERIERISTSPALLVASAGDKDCLLVANEKGFTTTCYGNISITNYSPFRITITDKEKFGVIDATGKVLIAPAYQLLYVVNDRQNQGNMIVDMANWLAKQDDKWGVIDEWGKTLIPLQYDELKECDTYITRFYAKKDGKWGLIDKAGKTLLTFTYATKEDMKKELDELSKKDPKPYRSGLRY